jgi:phage terminase large subunit-like protein
MRFVESYCVVPEGDLVGQPIRLADFQEDFFRSVYDNEVATKQAYLSIARKNSKTASIATIVLVHLVGPEAIQNSRISSGARSRKQAAEVYNYAAKMAQLSPELRKIIRAIPSGKKLVGLLMNTEYEALAAEGATAHGGSPILAVLDEVGQVRGPQDDFVDAIVTSQGAYSNALLIAISTQAPTDGDLFSIWLDGAATSKDPHTVSHVYTAPENCALDDEEAWRAANPALGLFRSRADLEKQARNAVSMPSSQNAFRVLCLNQRCNPFSPLIGKDEWMACAGDVQFMDGESVYLALDLSSVDDLTALVMVSAGDTDRVQPFIWKPEDVLKDHGERDAVDYREWVKAGHLLTMPGRTIAPSVIAAKIAELHQQYTVLGLAYDRWRMDSLMRELDQQQVETYKGDEGSGLKMVDWGQGYASMAPAVDAFERSVLERNLIHPGNPVLTWNVANAVVTRDPAGNRKLDKAKARFRIDGAVSTAMALGLKARERTEMASSSPWDDPNFSLVA